MPDRRGILHRPKPEDSPNAPALAQLPKDTSLKALGQEPRVFNLMFGVGVLRQLVRASSQKT